MSIWNISLTFHSFLEIKLRRYLQNVKTVCKSGEVARRVLGYTGVLGCFGVLGDFGITHRMMRISGMFTNVSADVPSYLLSGLAILIIRTGYCSWLKHIYLSNLN